MECTDGEGRCATEVEGYLSNPPSMRFYEHRIRCATCHRYSESCAQLAGCTDSNLRNICAVFVKNVPSRAWREGGRSDAVPTCQWWRE